MKIRVLGAGIYGCHIGKHLIELGHDVEIHEIADHIFAGASGHIPARLHCGTHYPRSRLTRAACQEHYHEFMQHYGHLTRCVPINIYAIAQGQSLVDFGNYLQTLRNEIDLIEIYDPAEFGLVNVEGAILTGERHLVIAWAKEFFSKILANNIRYNMPPGDVDSPDFDVTIDCTFCALDGANIDRYEPCVTGLLKGPVDKSVTIMDGPFPSVYVFNEDEGLLSITSAKWTPLDKCKTYADARAVLDHTSEDDIVDRCYSMIEDMSYYYPFISHYQLVDWGTAIRAMPLSGSDARLVDVVQGPKSIRIRAGKLDAIFHAAREIERLL